MEEKVRERWLELCELAAKEQNSEKLLALIKQINDLLEEKEAQRRKGNKSATAGKVSNAAASNDK